LIGAGDIAKCGEPGHVATAAWLGSYPDATIFTAGDNVYPHGTPDEWRDCYGPSWGQYKNRTRPVPGNHDYETLRAKPYYDYWGDRAGNRDLGYYTYTVGGWLIFALNSEIDMRPGSQQHTWLRTELDANRERPCTAAIWHRPLFTSSQNGPQTDTKPFWDLLYEFKTDVIINGHDHVYERFGPQDPNGNANAANGIRQFTVGTGGVPVYTFTTPMKNSEVRTATNGVLKLDLRADGYSWEFIPVANPNLRDSGAGNCH
jgi:hypothetical protein